MLIISHKSSEDFKNYLKDQGLDFIETCDNPNLDPRIADHPDLSLFILDDDMIVVDESLYDYYNELLKEKVIIKGEKVRSDYPYDAIYNIYKASDFYIHNDITESYIKDYLKSKSFSHYYCKQGYSRCSIIPMGDKILTSDYGMYKSLRDKIEVILLKSENILLDGFETGFIGGTCGLVDDRLIFNGNIEKSINYPTIKEEARKSSIKLVYPDLDLVDLGSIIHI